MGFNRSMTNVNCASPAERMISISAQFTETPFFQHNTVLSTGRDAFLHSSCHFFQLMVDELYPR